MCKFGCWQPQIVVAAPASEKSKYRCPGGVWGPLATRLMEKDGGFTKGVTLSLCCPGRCLRGKCPSQMAWQGRAGGGRGWRGSSNTNQRCLSLTELTCCPCHPGNSMKFLEVPKRLCKAGVMSRAAPSPPGHMGAMLRPSGAICVRVSHHHEVQMEASPLWDLRGLLDNGSCQTYPTILPGRWPQTWR